MGSGEAVRISNPAVDEILNDTYTLAELQTCIAQRLQWKGQDIAVFRLPRETICYNGGWFFMSSITTFEEHAYTVGELGQMLIREMHRIRISRSSENQWVYYLYEECTGKMYQVKYADTEADARGLMLCWLIENGHLDVEEINKETGHGIATDIS